MDKIKTTNAENNPDIPIPIPNPFETYTENAFMKPITVFITKPVPKAHIDTDEI